MRWVLKREWRKPWAFPGILLVGQWAFVEARGEGRPGLWVPLVRGSEHVGTVWPWTRGDAASWPRGGARGLSCCCGKGGIVPTQRPGWEETRERARGSDWRSVG